MNCQVCNHSEWEERYNGTLLKCSNCGFVTANMEISSDELNSLYSEKYFKGEEYLDYIADKKFIQKNFKKRLKRVEKLHSDISNVLEIGCAYGLFAELITQMYPNINYLGIDVSADAIDYASSHFKLNVKCVDYLKLSTDQSYSDIFMWDVIEHLPEPSKVIKKASEELKPGGFIHITTGNIDALVPRWQKQKWRLIHPPSHLHYFSKGTITRLLSESGFEIVKVSHPTIYRSVRQIYYSLFLLNNLNQKGFSYKLKIQVYKWIPAGFSVSINTFDIMFVTARKIS